VRRSKGKKVWKRGGGDRKMRIRGINGNKVNERECKGNVLGYLLVRLLLE
jgi:hypothetical protein